MHRLLIFLLSCCATLASGCVLIRKFLPELYKFFWFIFILVHFCQSQLPTAIQHVQVRLPSGTIFINNLVLGLKLLFWISNLEGFSHSNFELKATMNQLQSDTDPNSVIILSKKGPVNKTLKNPSELNAAMRRGAEIATEKKMMAGGNRQHTSNKNTAR